MIQLSMIPQESIDKYNLAETSHNRYIYARVKRGIYGIPQSGWIAHVSLVKNLEPY